MEVPCKELCVNQSWLVTGRRRGDSADEEEDEEDEGRPWKCRSAQLLLATYYDIHDTDTVTAHSVHSTSQTTNSFM